MIFIQGHPQANIANRSSGGDLVEVENAASRLHGGIVCVYQRLISDTLHSRKSHVYAGAQTRIVIGLATVRPTALPLGSPEL